MTHALLIGFGFLLGFALADWLRTRRAQAGCAVRAFALDDGAELDLLIDKRSAENGDLLRAAVLDFEQLAAGLLVRADRLRRRINAVDA